MSKRSYGWLVGTAVTLTLAGLVAPYFGGKPLWLADLWALGWLIGWVVLFWPLLYYLAWRIRVKR